MWIPLTYSFFDHLPSLTVLLSIKQELKYMHDIYCFSTLQNKSKNTVLFKKQTDQHTHTMMSVRTSVSRVQVSMEKFGRRSMTCPFSRSEMWTDPCGLLYIRLLLHKSHKSTPCAGELWNDTSPSKWLFAYIPFQLIRKQKPLI